MLVENPKQRGILIVDDDLGICSLLEGMLTEEGQELVLTARDGTEAVSILASRGEEIYLVLLDLVMPNLDGLGVMKHLANVHCYPVGIIVITGYASLERMRAFYETGTETVVASSFMHKPFDAKDLLIEINDTLERIHLKRLQQIDMSSENLFHRLLSIERQLAHATEALPKIEEKLSQLSRNQRGFLSELGMELLRAIVIAFAVIAIIYLGVGNLIRNIIQRLP